MPLTRDEVLHVASLCRIQLTDKEISSLQGQLSDIVEQFEVLRELDTEGTAAAQSRLSTVMRDDVPRDSAPREDVLLNAPRREGSFIRVPPVLEES